MLVGRIAHAHAAGDLQAIGMIGDAQIAVTTRHGGICHRFDGRGAVTPLRMGLEITTIILEIGRSRRRAAQNLNNGGATEEVGTQRVYGSEVDLSFRVGYGLFDRRTSPVS